LIPRVTAPPAAGIYAVKLQVGNSTSDDANGNAFAERDRAKAHVA